MITYEQFCSEARRMGWRVQLAPYVPRLSRHGVGHVLRLVDETGLVLGECWVGEGSTLDQAASRIWRLKAVTA
jgi:hypothetical protein